MKIATVVLLCAAALSVINGTGAYAQSSDPQTYSCAFDGGSVMVYDKGRFRTDKAQALAFGFGKFDKPRQAAVMTSPGGETAVRLVQAVNAMHFLEIAGEGFLNVTTIYDRDETVGTHPAVHSRHFGVLGQPIISQYHGFCTAK